MQAEKENKFPPIKRRVHMYLKIKGITHEYFFGKTKISTSSFSGKSANSEFGGEILSRIKREFPLINTTWLLIGEGEMEDSPKGNATIGQVNGNSNIVSNGNNIRFHYPGAHHSETEETPWFVKELEAKNRQLFEKDEQIKKLTDMLSSIQKTVDTLLGLKN